MKHNINTYSGASSHNFDLGLVFRRSMNIVLLLGLIFAFLYTFSAFAQGTAPVVSDSTVVTPPPGLDWLGGLIEFMQTLPYVGPFLVGALKWVGAIAAIFTGLSTAVSAVLKIPELAARWSGAVAIADKILAFHDKIKPWLDYLSIFNKKKK